MSKIAVAAILALVSLVLVAGCQRGDQTPIPQQEMPIQQQGSSADETKLLKGVVKEDPGNLQAWIKLGNNLMDAGSYKDAAEAYEKALAIDPNNIDVRVDMGTCYKNTGRPDKAVEAYRKALEKDPKHLNALRNLGITLAYDLNDRPGAVKAFEEYLRLYPSAPDAKDLRQFIEALKQPMPK